MIGAAQRMHDIVRQRPWNSGLGLYCAPQFNQCRIVVGQTAMP
jgi:hypothetical protein